jgi:hypothetical protein
MLASDIQDHLNTGSTFINAVQWLSKRIPEISQVYSTISSVTSSAMDLNIWGFTIGEILFFGTRVASDLVIHFPLTGNFSLTKWTLLGDSGFALTPAAAASPA